MNFLFSSVDNSGVFKYGIPNFYRVSRSTLDENSVVVGTPTAPPGPSVCEYISKPVEGLNSANNEEPEKGPDMPGEAGKLPNPQIAVIASSSEKVHPPTGDMVETSSSEMSSDDSGPEEKYVLGADDFTDFFSNIGSKLLKKYAEKKGQKRKSSNHKTHHESKKRKKKDTEVYHSRKRVPSKSNVKVIHKKK